MNRIPICPKIAIDLTSTVHEFKQQKQRKNQGVSLKICPLLWPCDSRATRFEPQPGCLTLRHERNAKASSTSSEGMMANP